MLMLLWKSIEVLKFAVIDLVFQPIVAKWTSSSKHVKRTIIKSLSALNVSPFAGLWIILESREWSRYASISSPPFRPIRCKLKTNGDFLHFNNLHPKSSQSDKHLISPKQGYPWIKHEFRENKGMILN